MASIFNDLLTFFGITAAAPQNLGDLFPWVLSIHVALTLFLFVFGMIKDFVHTFGRGKF